MKLTVAVLAFVVSVGSAYADDVFEQWQTKTYHAASCHDVKRFMYHTPEDVAVTGGYKPHSCVLHVERAPEMPPPPAAPVRNSMAVSYIGSSPSRPITDGDLEMPAFLREYRGITYLGVAPGANVNNTSSDLVHVRAYTRDDGTHVDAYDRTRADATTTNNLSYRGPR